MVTSKVMTQDENPANEKVAKGDPNLVGNAETAAIQQRTAGAITGCSEYDDKNSSHGASKYAGY